MMASALASAIVLCILLVVLVVVWVIIIGSRKTRDMEEMLRGFREGKEYRDSDDKR